MNSTMFHSNILKKTLEPNGGNLYRPHIVLIKSGQYWKCQHGKTGIGQCAIVQCLRCWVGFKLSLIVARFTAHKCAVCACNKNTNIIGGEFVCDHCFTTIQQEREARKNKHGE